MNNKKIGIFIMVVALIYLVKQVWVPDMNLWTVVGGAIFVVGGIYNLIKLQFRNGLTCLLLGYWLLSKVFNFLLPVTIAGISFWTLFVFVLLFGWGLDLMFGDRSYNFYKTKIRGERSGIKCADVVSETTDANQIDVTCRFGSLQQYVQSSAFIGGYIRNSFGAVEINFAQAQLAELGAHLNVNCSFGAVELYIPREWSVQNNISVSLGAVDDDRFGVKDMERPTLILTGKVSLGELKIIYI